MNFLKKLIKNYKESQRDKEINEQDVDLSLDDSFVHNFINKNGKFLYCTKIDEIVTQLNNILKENNWNHLLCSDIDLLKVLKKTNAKIETNFTGNLTYFTTCEHLIAHDGDILFTSNQLGSNKLPSYSENFIVYATTSQIVRNTGDGLTSIKNRFSGNLPTNISAIKNYAINDDKEESFMDYGNTNSKNLYLLLFEDL